MTLNTLIPQELSAHEDWAVRWLVASFQHTPSNVLHTLKDDTTFQVRLAVAKNRNTNRITLCILETDPDTEVASTAKKALE